MEFVQKTSYLLRNSYNFNVKLNELLAFTSEIHCISMGDQYMISP